MSTSNAPEATSLTPTNQAARRATIMDVAREAGVSRQTVTRAMNDMSEISTETRERVLAVSELLGYRPSRFAANMPRQKSRAVALAINSLRNPYYTDLAADVLEEFSAQGWQVLLAADQKLSGPQLVASLSGQADAIIGYFESDDDDALRRAARGVPLVRFEAEARSYGIHAIDIDFATGIREYINGLRERGAHRIGMIEHGNPRRRYAPSARRRWFEQCVDTETGALVAIGDDTMAGGAIAFDELIARRPDIDTIVAFNDMMAFGAIQRAHQRGMRVPEDLRIAGIDGLSLAVATTPTLTTLSIDRPLIAQSTATLLNDVLAAPGASQAPQNVIVTPLPEWRESA